MKKPKKIIGILPDVANYSYITIGNTKEECEESLCKRYRSHYGNKSNEEIKEWFGICFYELADGEVIEI